MIVSTPAEFLHPLTYFCRHGGDSLPRYHIIDGNEVPEPYRSLLVHDGDMTSRLESFHRGSIRLDVLHREETADAYRREVLLRVEASDLAVEYGAIEIHLGAFDRQLREKIVEARIPLGGLLNHYDLNYRSQPRGFIKFAPDPKMDALFGVTGAHALYGRANVLLGENDIELARIVEVLRP